MGFRWFLIPLISIPVLLLLADTAQAQSRRTSSSDETIRAKRMRIEDVGRDAKQALRHVERGVAAPSRAGEIVMQCLAIHPRRNRRQCSFESLKRERERAEREVARAANVAARAGERLRPRGIRDPRGW